MIKVLEPISQICAFLTISQIKYLWRAIGSIPSAMMIKPLLKIPLGLSPILFWIAIASITWGSHQQECINQSRNLKECWETINTLIILSRERVLMSTMRKCLKITMWEVNQQRWCKIKLKEGKIAIIIIWNHRHLASLGLAISLTNSSTMLHN